MIPQADYQMLLLTRLAEQSLKAVGPAGSLELELAPVEINELAVSFAVKSYYFHIALLFFIIVSFEPRNYPKIILKIIQSLAPCSGLAQSRPWS